MDFSGREIAVEGEAILRLHRALSRVWPQSSGFAGCFFFAENLVSILFLNIGRTLEASFAFKPIS